MADTMPPPAAVPTKKNQPKSREPTYPTTVDGDQFQVVGEENLYSDPCDAIDRAKVLGAGHAVTRMSDGKVIAHIPGYTPPPPREFN